MRSLLLLFFLLYSVLSFAGNSEIVEPSAEKPYYSVKMNTDVALLGLKGRVKSCRINLKDAQRTIYYLFDEYGFFKHVEDGEFVFCQHSVYDEFGNMQEFRRMRLQPKIETWQAQYIFSKTNHVEEEVWIGPDGKVQEYFHYFLNKKGHLLKMETLNKAGKIVAKSYKQTPNSTQSEGDDTAVNGPQNFVYNSSGQLVSVLGDKFTISYEYDAVGNKVLERKVFAETKKEELTTYTIEYY